MGDLYIGVDAVNAYFEAELAEELKFLYFHDLGKIMIN